MSFKTFELRGHDLKTCGNLILSYKPPYISWIPVTIRYSSVILRKLTLIGFSSLCLGTFTSSISDLICSATFMNISISVLLTVATCRNVFCFGLPFTRIFSTICMDTLPLT